MPRASVLYDIRWTYMDKPKLSFHQVLAEHQVSEDGLLDLIADAARSHNKSVELAARAALSLAKELAREVNADVDNHKG